VTRRILAGAVPGAEPSDRALAEARDAGFLWLDIEAPDAADLGLLRDVFGADAGLVEPGPAGPRPRLHEEDGFIAVTLAGAASGDDDGDDGLCEVHCLVARGWMVTVHGGRCAPLDVPGRHPGSPAQALCAVAEAMVTSLVQVVGGLSHMVERLEETESRGDVGRARRRLTPLRRVVLPQLDVLDRLEGDDGVLAGDSELTRRMRNAAERMTQVGHELEALREAVHDIASDRANNVMKKLTAIAGIFLPITFLTGFFGQNFSWMVDHVGGPGWFVGLGIGLPIGTAAVLVAFFRRRDWL
jgi:magnesium transporter